MIPGLELWPDQDDDKPISQADLDQLVEATRGLSEVLLKARWHSARNLAQVAEAVSGAWFATRPRSEGYTAGDIAEGIASASNGMSRAGLLARWVVHEAFNEANHPNGPFRDVGAEAYALVLAEAFTLVDAAGVPLGSGGLTPMYGTGAWAAVLDRFRFTWRCAHCYGEHVADDGDSEEPSMLRALTDTVTQAGAVRLDRIIVTEVGDATRSKSLDGRIAWTGQVMQRLSRLGVTGAAMFILRAPGWEHYQLGASAFNSIMRSVAQPSAWIPPTTQPTPVEVPVTNNEIGDGVRKAMAALGDEPVNADADEQWDASVTVGKKYGYLYDKSGGGVVAFEKVPIPKA